MFIHMGFSQAICAADLLPGNAPPCWGVEPVRSSGVWPRKQLGYPDEVLPSQCGLDESCHIKMSFHSPLRWKYHCIKRQGQLFESPKFFSISSFCMEVNSSWAYEAKSFSTLVICPSKELWCIKFAQNLHNLEIFRFWLVQTLTESLYKVNNRLWSVCRSKLPQTPLKGDWTVNCRFSLSSWKSDVNLKWLLCFNIYIFYDLLKGTKFWFFFFLFGGEETAQAVNSWQKMCASLWKYCICADGVLLFLLSRLVDWYRAMITSRQQ